MIIREDNSFIRFTKNDFEKAKRSDNQNVVSIPIEPIIQMLPNETFYQISNSSVNISFVGGILVELIDCCETVLKNVTPNFYYTNFTDRFGVVQIVFEFGNINDDFYKTPIHLKITDLVNNNKFYSQVFCLTNYESHLSGRFDYTANNEIYGIPYDIVNYKKQSIRIANCYENTPITKETKDSYTEYNGDVVNYRNIITPLDEYIITKLDKFTSNRLIKVFSHPKVFLNGQSVSISNFKVGKREGTVNWGSGTFEANPKLELLDFAYQLYQPLRLVSQYPAHNQTYNTSANINQIIGDYNKNITLNTGFLRLYEDGVLINTFTELDITVLNNTFTLNLPISLIVVGEYNITITQGLFSNGLELSPEVVYGDWTFKNTNGFYNNIYYNNNFYLTD